MPRTEKRASINCISRRRALAEAELEKDVHNAIKTTLFAYLAMAAGIEDPASLTMLLVRGLADGKPTTQSLPTWLTDMTSNFTVEEFQAHRLLEEV